MDGKQPTAQLEVTEDGRWLLSGDLSMSTVPALLTQNRFPAISDTLNVDLQGVERTDSAGLALLVEWQREANQQQRNIRFQNIPSQMLAIARLSGVDELLSLS